MFRTKTYTAKLNSTTHENLNKFLRHLTFWYNAAINKVSIKTTPDMCTDIKIGSGSVANYSTYNDVIKVDTYVNSPI